MMQGRRPMLILWWERRKPKKEHAQPPAALEKSTVACKSTRGRLPLFTDNKSASALHNRSQGPSVHAP